LGNPTPSGCKLRKIMRLAKRIVCLVPAIWLCSLSTLPLASQLSKPDRELALSMLRDADQDVQKYYYDPGLHNVDWSAKVRQARDTISKADSLDNAVSEVAALLDSLNDSHTYLSLPARTHTHDYGFKLQMIGDHCYVLNVKAGSDAEKKGLKRGDEILAINDHSVSRRTLWRLHYIYDSLRPQAGLRLVLSGEGSERRQMDVMAKNRLIEGKQIFTASGNQPDCTRHGRLAAIPKTTLFRTWGRVAHRETP
jgi:C-terminal processing protease CtpA/Prc